MILELGQGTTSKVYLGFLNQEPAKPAAIKIFKPVNDSKFILFFDA